MCCFVRSVFWYGDSLKPFKNPRFSDLPNCPFLPHTTQPRFCLR
jgi:hypothetical protein